MTETFAELCRAADEKQRRKPIDRKLARLRKLLEDDVSIERAWHELNRRDGVARATLEAAEFLIRQGDSERFHKWLSTHGAAERAEIQRYLEDK